MENDELCAWKWLHCILKSNTQNNNHQSDYENTFEFRAIVSRNFIQQKAHHHLIPVSSCAWVSKYFKYWFFLHSEQFTIYLWSASHFMLVVGISSISQFIFSFLISDVFLIHSRYLFIFLCWMCVCVFWHSLYQRISRLDNCFVSSRIQHAKFVKFMRMLSLLLFVRFPAHRQANIITNVFLQHLLPTQFFFV